MITKHICNICMATPIFEKKNGVVSFTQEYAEVTLLLSDETVMRHGICRSCHAQLDDEKIVRLFAKIREHLLDDLVGRGNDAQFEHLRALEVIGWDRSFDEALRRHKDVLRKVHEDKIALSHAQEGTHATH